MFRTNKGCQASAKKGKWTLFYCSSQKDNLYLRYYQVKEVRNSTDTLSINFERVKMLDEFHLSSTLCWNRSPPALWLGWQE